MKRNHLLVESEEQFEQEAVVCFSELPIELILESILDAVGGDICICSCKSFIVGTKEASWNIFKKIKW